MGLPSIRSPAFWAYASAALMVVGFVLAMLELPPEESPVGPESPVVAAQFLVFAASILALLPVIGALHAPSWGRAAGYVWAGLAITGILMQWNGVNLDLLGPFRWGLHVVLAVWILVASFSHTGAMRWVGAIGGLWMGLFSFLAPWMDDMLVFPGSLFLIAWLVLVGRRLPHESSDATD